MSEQEDKNDIFADSNAFGKFGNQKFKKRGNSISSDSDSFGVENERPKNSDSQFWNDDDDNNNNSSGF